MAARALEDRVVVRVRMARCAHAVRVAVASREPCVLRVIEDRGQPCRRVMAGRTLRRRKECRLRRMSRIRRVVIGRQVAADAGQRQRGVVVVHVAGSARSRRVESGQRERRVVVIERRIRPVNRIVAQLTGRREARVRNRGRRPIKVRLVARNTGGDRDVVVVVLVARSARCG